MLLSRVAATEGQTKNKESKRSLVSNEIIEVQAATSNNRKTGRTRKTGFTKSEKQLIAITEQNKHSYEQPGGDSNTARTGVQNE